MPPSPSSHSTSFLSLTVLCPPFLLDPTLLQSLQTLYCHQPRTVSHSASQLVCLLAPSVSNSVPAKPPNPIRNFILYRVTKSTVEFPNPLQKPHPSHSNTQCSLLSVQHYDTHTHIRYVRINAMIVLQNRHKATGFPHGISRLALQWAALGSMERFLALQ